MFTATLNPTASPAVIAAILAKMDKYSFAYEIETTSEAIVIRQTGIAPKKRKATKPKAIKPMFSHTCEQQVNGSYLITNHNNGHVFNCSFPVTESADKKIIREAKARINKLLLTPFDRCFLSGGY